MHVEILGHVGPVESTCLGLTCKKLYDVHSALHGKVKLRTEARGSFPVMLGDLLQKGWSELVWNVFLSVFTTAESYEIWKRGESNLVIVELVESRRQLLRKLGWLGKKP